MQPSASGERLLPLRERIVPPQGSTARTHPRVTRGEAALRACMAVQRRLSLRSGRCVRSACACSPDCRVRTLPGHKQRVGCMAWSHHTLATGSRDRLILQRDVRSPEPFVQKLAGHRSEVRKNACLRGPACCLRPLRPGFMWGSVRLRAQ
jgi:WD40 repeat protein